MVMLMISKIFPANKRLSAVILLIFTVLTVLTLASCGDNALKFKNDGDTGNLIDEENDRYYIYCRGYLQAAAIKPEIYAKGDRKEKLYEVDGIDPSQWLSEDISNLKITPFLFREQSVEEPKFEDFETERIHVTMAEEINYKIFVIDGGNNEEDIEIIEKIVNDYMYNEQVSLPEFITDSFNFYFESEKYKGIYYVLQYLIDEKNDAYLYDRWTKRCVPCSFKLFGGSGVGNDIDDIDIE